MERAVLETKALIRPNKTEDYSLFGSFPDDAALMLSVQCQELLAARLILHCDGLSSPAGEVYREYILTPNASCFSVLLTAEELRDLSPGGLYYYRYSLSFPDGTEEYGGEGATLLEKAALAGDRQLLLYAHDFRTPSFLKQGILYHIFVDRFAASGKCPLRKGSRLNRDWENGIPEYPPYPGAQADNREFFGGDLYGIIGKLPYLASLGVTCLYLSPIFESPSNHKYDTADYSKVDAAFGGEEALCQLIRQAKKAGISVMLDGVFNHTGDDSLYFNRRGTYPSLGAYQSTASPYYSWYSFEHYPDRYACWWGVKILPKVNCDQPSYADYMLGENGIVEKYMKLGVAGFRLDVADELSDHFLTRLRSAVRRVNPDGIVLGEVWEDASNKIAYSRRRHYFAGNQLDSVMNYPIRSGIIAYLKSGDALPLRRITEGIYRRYPKCVSDCLMNLLGTHDTERILTVLAGEASHGKTNTELAHLKMTASEKIRGMRMLKVAYTLLAFLYGVPSIYYGDEAGIEGYGDPFCRRPYPWGKECDDLLAFYRQIGHIRRRESILAEGLFAVDTAEGGLFAYRRFSRDTAITVVANAGASSVRFQPESGAVPLIQTADEIRQEDGFFCLPPMSAMVLKQEHLPGL